MLHLYEIVHVRPFVTCPHSSHVVGYVREESSPSVRGYWCIQPMFRMESSLSRVFSKSSYRAVGEGLVNLDSPHRRKNGGLQLPLKLALWHGQLPKESFLWEICLGGHTLSWPGDVLCPMCLGEEELVDHLFVHCTWVSRLWG